jgi:DNA invertase Pin-like site-specific DNA recombinase
MKVAIYARVSTEEQHVDKQVEQMKDFCKRHDHEIHDTYVDVMSGAKASRPEFNRLLGDLRKYRFRAVVVTKLDRLGRSLQHLISLLDEFKSKGVDFIATTQNIDTTSAAGRLQWQIMGAFAEFEREIIRERTREGMKTAKNVGKRGKDKKPRKKRGVLRTPLSI